MIVFLHLMCLAIYTIKIKMVAMFCPYRYFPLKLAIHHFDCNMVPFFSMGLLFLRLILCNESEIIPSFKINAPVMSMPSFVIDNYCMEYKDLWSLEMVSVRQV